MEGRSRELSKLIYVMRLRKAPCITIETFELVVYSSNLTTTGQPLPRFHNSVRYVSRESCVIRPCPSRTVDFSDSVPQKTNGDIALSLETKENQQSASRTAII